MTNDTAAFQHSQRTGETMLVDFYAPWCAPCMTMMPMLEDFSVQIAGRARLLKVDVDKNIDLALEQKIMGVPTFVLYRQGREIWRHSGVLSKSELLHALDVLEI
jgi:thioredoxin 1